jgi:hypothetical protein
MTTLRPTHPAMRALPCVGRGVPAPIELGAGLGRRRAYAGKILAAASWSLLGSANQAEGFGLCSKDTTREVLPT